MRTIAIVLLWTPLAAAGIEFVENARERGIDFVQVNGSPQKDYLVEAKGAGVAAADVNGDGWDDLYFVNGAYLSDPPETKPRNQLYLNRGDGTFADFTDESGLGDERFGTGAAFGDVDNDGDLDCYLTNYGPNQLYLNGGGARFAPVANAGGAQCPGMSTGAAFADITGDGYLDLFVGNYAEFSREIADRMGKLAPFHGRMSFIGPTAFEPAEDRLFINNGDGTFRDETPGRGINSFGKGRAFTAKFSDLDGDGDLDIYIANDTTYNQLYENLGDGRFEDVSLIAGAGLSEDGKEQGGMGLVIGDADGDLDLDIAVANYQRENNILYRNEGGLQFSDATFASGAGLGTNPMVAFGLLLEDFDNDGRPDLFAANGHVYPFADELDFLHGYAQPNQLFVNAGGGTFENRQTRYGPAGSKLGVSRGSAAADFDRDGDTDIVINNLDGPPFFLENRTEGGNWLQVAVLNRFGAPDYGALVTVRAGGTALVRELHSSDSFLSQSSAAMHFGLGPAPMAESIAVRFSGGRSVTLSEVKANQRVTVRRED